jgi:hypothetical protein
MTYRPGSSLLLGGLALVLGVLSFVGGWFLMLSGTVGSTFGAPTGATVLILGSLMFAVGLASLVVGYGLWRMRTWGWSGAFVVFGASIFVDVASVVLTAVSVLDVVFTVAVAVVAMWFLLQPSYRNAYGH